MEKNEGGTIWGHEKISRKIFQTEIFEQCHSAEKLKRGTLCNFLTSIVLQNIERNEGVTLWCNPKSFKTSHSVEKKWGFLVCFRGSGRLFFFRFGRASEVGVVY